MPEITVYIKANRNTEVQEDDVFLKDIASVHCSDKTTLAKARSIKIHRFHEKEPKRCVISILKVIQLLEEQCPGISVESLGEADVLIERICVDKHKGWQQWCKAAVVALICFFGTGFTIMAFHNDIGIQKVFAEVYRVVMGKETTGFTILEVSYSIGLAIGIVVFFNHIGGRRITKDPTPIEVSMKEYEKNVDITVIETADREGKTIDAS